MSEGNPTELNNDVVGEFLKLVTTSMLAVRNHPKYDISKNNYHLFTRAGKYEQRVFNFYSKLIDVKDDLKKIEIFLRRYPFKKFYHDNDIDKIAYIKYHLEVYFHKIHTLTEILKLMTNEVYQFGLTPEKCNWKNLVKCNSLEINPSLKVIEYFHESFEHLIKLRHLNTHRGFFKDAQGDDIQIPRFIYANERKNGREPDKELLELMPELVIDYLENKYKKNRLEYIRQGNKVAEQYLNLYLNITLPEAIKRASEMSNGS
jgi:hypothetical protein